jgi:hypothetical protein
VDPTLCAFHKNDGKMFPNTRKGTTLRPSYQCDKQITSKHTNKTQHLLKSHMYALPDSWFDSARGSSNSVVLDQNYSAVEIGGGIVLGVCCTYATLRSHHFHIHKSTWSDHLTAVQVPISRTWKFTLEFTQPPGDLLRRPSCLGKGSSSLKIKVFIWFRKMAYLSVHFEYSKMPSCFTECTFFKDFQRICCEWFSFFLQSYVWDRGLSSNQQAFSPLHLSFPSGSHVICFLFETDWNILSVEKKENWELEIAFIFVLEFS